MAKKPEDKEMPFLEHLEELRWGLIRALIALAIGMVLCFVVAPYILKFLTFPAARLDPPLIFQFLKVQGMLIVYLEIGFFGGLILALPYIFHQLWQFVAPGLLPNERRYFIPLIICGTGLFMIGLSLAYWVVLPLALNFLVGLAPSDINANIAIDFYIGFAIRLMFLFGIVFEMPLVCYFLAKIGIVTSAWMKQYRRHAIVVIFVMAAFLTPPDPITQIILGIPLLLLYEVSVYIVRGVEKAAERREKLEEEKFKKEMERERTQTGSQ